MKVRFGIVADPHYADRSRWGSRYYRESLDKMCECVDLMNNEEVDFLIELGDFKDQRDPADEETTLQDLEAIEDVLKQFEGPRYHVLGNHDVDSISKGQFLDRIENTGIAKDRSYYSFHRRGIDFLVLDANYNADSSDYDHGDFDWTDTNIPPEQLEWLTEKLAATSNPVIVFIHQLLDGQGRHYVENASEVRKLLRSKKNVLAVFQGHDHKGRYSNLDNTHYYTLKAMVEGSGAENNAYAIVQVRNNYDLAVTGYRKAVSREWSPAPARTIAF